MTRKPTKKAPSKTPKQLAELAPLAARPDDQIATPGVPKVSAEEWARNTEQRRPEMEQRSVREVGPQGAREMPFLKAVPDWFDYVPREMRLFEDWTTSSASAHRDYAHWALHIRDYEYRGEREVGFIPRPLHQPTERLFASEDSSVHMLLDRIEALDREVGLPFGWFFLMTHGHWVAPEGGDAIATALRDQRVRLPDRDSQALLRWADKPYGF
jgi:hypothetical protein